MLKTHKFVLCSLFFKNCLLLNHLFIIQSFIVILRSIIIFLNNTEQHKSIGEDGV